MADATDLIYPTSTASLRMHLDAVIAAYERNEECWTAEDRNLHGFMLTMRTALYDHANKLPELREIIGWREGH